MLWSGARADQTAVCQLHLAQTDHMMTILKHAASTAMPIMTSPESLMPVPLLVLMDHDGLQVPKLTVDDGQKYIKVSYSFKNFSKFE